MAGVYGEINSRADFFRVLAEARQFCVQMLGHNPNDTIYRRIAMELEAMEKWTANGRTPTKDERRSIDIAVIAVRELEPLHDPATQSIADKLKILDAYLEDWPSDHKASTSTDDDFWEGDDDDEEENDENES